MALPEPDDDQGWVNLLSKLHDAEMGELEDLNKYYDGTQPLTYMHPEIYREVQDRIKPVIIAWPQLVVDTIEERLDVEGFRLPDKEEEETDLRRVWQANEMDEQSQMAHVDALVMGRSYLSVGTSEDDADTPLTSAESPLEMYAYVDPRTRTLLAALKRVKEADSFARVNNMQATLYLPNRTVWYEWAGQKWTMEDDDEHNLGRLPVAALVNRPRLSVSARTTSATRRVGRSEMQPILPLSDAANKIATDMMLAAEAVALPLRGFMGASPEDLVDKEGNQLTAVQMAFRKFLTVPDPDGGAKPFDFKASDLSNFHNSIEALAKLVWSVSGLTPNDLGFSTDNPASADAIRSGEIRKIKRCERKQRSFGGGHEEWGRIVRRFQTGEWDPELRMLETVWADAATPTVGMKADAAVKLYTTQPRPIVPLRQTREDLRYTATQIKRMEEEDEREAERDPNAEIARGLADMNRADVSAESGA